MIWLWSGTTFLGVPFLGVPRKMNASHGMWDALPVGTHYLLVSLSTGNISLENISCKNRDGCFDHPL